MYKCNLNKCVVALKVMTWCNVVGKIWCFRISFWSHPQVCWKWERCQNYWVECWYSEGTRYEWSTALHKINQRVNGMVIIGQKDRTVRGRGVGEQVT